MIQVWQCQYCGHTHEDPKRMEGHEAKCLNNPIIRTCSSCDFYHGENTMSGFMTECRSGKLTPQEAFEIDDDNLECIHHKPSIEKCGMHRIVDFMESS